MKAELGGGGEPPQIAAGDARAGGARRRSAARRREEARRMIVRISGEGQYRLADEDARPTERARAGRAVTLEDGRATGFPGAYGGLLDFVRSSGERLGDDELEPSQVILPPADISFDEASQRVHRRGPDPRLRSGIPQRGNQRSSSGSIGSSARSSP